MEDYELTNVFRKTRRGDQIQIGHARPPWTSEMVYEQRHRSYRPRGAVFGFDREESPGRAGSRNES